MRVRSGVLCAVKCQQAPAFRLGNARRLPRRQQFERRDWSVVALQLAGRMWFGGALHARDFAKFAQLIGSDWAIAHNPNVLSTDRNNRALHAMRSRPSIDNEVNASA